MTKRFISVNKDDATTYAAMDTNDATTYAAMDTNDATTYAAMDTNDATTNDATMENNTDTEPVVSWWTEVGYITKHDSDLIKRDCLNYETWIVTRQNLVGYIL